MDQSQYDQYGTDQFQYNQYGGIDVPPEDPYGLNFGFGVPETPRNSNAILPIPPQPPNLQTRAQLDADGNWFYPSADQANHDLRIQCEAFRAGAASRPGAPQPFHFDQDPRQPHLATPRAPPRKILRPVSRRFPRPAKSRATAGRKKKKTSVAQICVCHEKTFVPKRPPNAFMMFRTKFQPQLVKMIESDPSLRRKNKNGREASLQATVSSLASEWWNGAKDRGEDKQYWALAEREKEAHARRYPNYKYEAGKKYQLSWGDETCQCGAYQANEAKKRGREAGTLDSDRNEVRYDYEMDEYEEEEGDPPYPSATSHQGFKRPGSRSSFRESLVKRRGGSVLFNNAGDPADLDDDSVFPIESYSGNFANAAYGVGTGNDTRFYNTNQTGNIFDRQKPYVPRSQSVAGVSPTARQGPRQWTAFPIDYQQAEVNEEDLIYTVPDFGDTGGGLYDTGVSQNGLSTHDANQRQVPDENTPMRGVSGGSFDSLFDMNGYEAQGPGGSRSARSSRSGQPQPANANGMRRTSRRSQV